MYVSPNGDTFPCCVNKEKMGKISGNLLSDWNSNNYRKLRKEMLSGQAPYSCETCVSEEAAQGASLRKRLDHSFGKKELEFVKKTDEEGTVPNLNIKYLDFRWSNLCNFKCRFCSHSLSSSWFEDEAALEGRLGLPKVLKPNISWRTIEEDILPNVEEVELLGGEPLIMEETYRILETLLKMKRKDVRISMVTNVSRFALNEKKILPLLTAFESVSMSLSVDGIGPRFEYMRKGGRWDEVFKNLKEIERTVKKSSKTKNIFRAKIFFSVYFLNAFHCVEAISYLKKSLDLPLKVNLSTSPEYSRIDRLPREFKKSLRVHYEKSDLLEVKEIARFMNAESVEESVAAKLLKENFIFNKNLDRLRGEDFSSTFPEWQKLIANSSKFNYLIEDFG